jgi:predicted Zn-ribbon and HTH transcriptional regulator
MNIEQKMSNVATALSGLSGAVDAAIDAVRHDEAFRNHPECREIEREICAILNLNETAKKMNAVWRRLSLLNAVPPCPRCGRCGFIEDSEMNLAGVCPDCNGAGRAIILHNVEAWHPLPGAPLRFRLRFVTTL